MPLSLPLPSPPQLTALLAAPWGGDGRTPENPCPERRKRKRVPFHLLRASFYSAPRSAREHCSVLLGSTGCTPPGGQACGGHGQARACDSPCSAKQGCLGDRKEAKKDHTHRPAAPKSWGASGPGQGQQHPKPHFIILHQVPRGLTTTLPCPSLKGLLLGFSSLSSPSGVIPGPLFKEASACCHSTFYNDGTPECGALMDLAVYTSTKTPEH